MMSSGAGEGRGGSVVLHQALEAGLVCYEDSFRNVTTVDRDEVAYFVKGVLYSGVAEIHQTSLGQKTNFVFVSADQLFGDSGDYYEKVIGMPQSPICPGPRGCAILGGAARAGDPG